MVIVEKSFPRGGTIDAIQKKESDVQTTEHIVFGAVQKKIKKSNRKVNVTSTENAESLEASSAELLNYNTIQEGMNVMGIIKKVGEVYLTVDLPGRIVAKVSALDISDAYTQAAENFIQANNQEPSGYNTLPDLFKIGQIVYGRVQEVKRNDKGHTLLGMTLKPSCVHSELHHDSIRKGFLFAGSIESIEDHGYIIESGIKRTRCFLPYDQSDKGFVIGQSIYLKVTKITHDKSVSTCICKQVAVDELIVKNQQDINLDYLLPTTIVKFRINKILLNGVQGTIIDETFTAYANEHHLTKPFTLPKDLNVNAVYNARILYVMPLTKFVFVTLNLQNNSLEYEKEVIDKDAPKILKRGEIIENAKVYHIGTGGVIFMLNNEMKGIVSFKTIKVNCKANYDQDVLMTKYSKNSLHKVRILDYDIMDSLYICTDDAKIVNEKFFSVNDIKSGDYVTAVIQESNKKIRGYMVQIGKIRGVIDKFYLASPGKHLEAGTKIKCRVIYTDIERHMIYVTNRPEYLDKNCKLLKSFDEANVDAKYMGTVVNSTKSNVILVKFFGNIKGIMYKNSKHPNTIDAETLMEGQTMLFRIASKRNGQIILSLLESNFKFGEICTITVVQNLESGLEVQAVHQSDNGTECTIKGVVPIRLLSDFENLLLAKLGMFENGDNVKAVCVSNNIFSLRDVIYFSCNSVLKWQDLKCGDILKAYVHNVTGDGEIVELMLPISNFKQPIKMHAKMLLMNVVNLGNISLSAEQVLYVKVLGKEDATRSLSVSGKLMDVWQGKLDLTAQYVESYLSEIKEIKETLKKKGSSIANFSVGQKITARFQYVDESSNDWIYALEKTDAIGVIKCDQIKMSELPKINQSQNCIILWIDYSNSIVYMSNKPTDIDHICGGEKMPKKLFGKFPFYHEAKVLYKNHEVMICSLKKRNNPIIYCPVRLYYNDLEEIGGATIVEGDFCKLAFIHRTLPIAVLQHIHKLYKHTNKRKYEVENEMDEIAVKMKKPKLKEKKKAGIKLQNEQKCHDERQVENEVNESDVNMKIAKLKEKKKKTSKQQNENANCNKTSMNVDSAFECTNNSEMELFYEDKACSKEVDIGESNQIFEQSKGKSQKFKVKMKEMPNISGFWDLSAINNDEVSSDDDLENNIPDTAEIKQNDKKKLSASEKFKLEKEEEARLRAIEEKYSDPKQMPETIDQFDRLVLSEPDNSKCWINYMVFHLQSSEIEKARSVARRALKAISYRNVEDRLNIWVALLNLELRYDSKETFNDTLKEALMCNDQKSIYLRTLDILTDAQKISELQDLVAVIIRKFGKSAVDIWKSAANALFSIGLAEKAQQLLHKSLTALPEREHITAIVTFANLNYKYGFKELAQTLLDQVVSSYPKRVDVWSQYVDMLIKEELIDSARNVLERAVSQIIPMRKMRTIFKKYLEFEERYGDDAKAQRVKQLALEFVNKSQHL